MARQHRPANDAAREAAKNGQRPRSAATPAPPTRSKRSYQLGQRQAGVEETRARIVDAAIELYETTGPAATSMTAVAERAGVTRATLYRHFPTDAALADAVVAEWRAANPGVDTVPPEPGGDRTTVVTGILERLYRQYRATATMTEHLLRDVRILPPDRIDDVRAPARRTREVLAPLAGAQASGAVIGHAVAFETWRSLSTEGLDDRTIARLMAGLITSAGPAAQTSAGPRAAAVRRGRAAKQLPTAATTTPEGAPTAETPVASRRRRPTTSATAAASAGRPLPSAPAGAAETPTAPAPSAASGDRAEKPPKSGKAAKPGKADKPDKGRKRKGERKAPKR